MPQGKSFEVVCGSSHDSVESESFNILSRLSACFLDTSTLYLFKAKAMRAMLFLSSRSFRPAKPKPVKPPYAAPSIDAPLM